MSPQSNAIFSDGQSPLECKLRAELDLAAARYQQAKHNYQAALELESKPWFRECPTANEAVHRALLDVNEARATYASILRSLSNLYARPEEAP